MQTVNSVPIRYAYRLLVWGVFIAALLGFVRFMYTGYLEVFYKYGLNLGEPALAQTIERLSQGLNPYRILDGPPYSLTPYGPVYLIFSSLIGWVIDGPFAGPRFITYLATITCTFMIFKSLRVCRLSLVPSLAGGFLFTLIPVVDRWGVQVNVDMTGLALELSALWLILKHEFSDTKKPIALNKIAVFIVAAFFTKSSCIVVAAAYFVTLILSRRIKEGLRFFFITGAAAIVVYTLINFMTSGMYWWHTTYEISQRIFFKEFIWRFWRDLFLEIPVFFSMIPVAALLLLKDSKYRIFSVYVVLSVLITVSLGKQGSDTNYMLPFIAAGTLAVFAAFLHESKPLWLRAATGALLITQILLIVPASFSFLERKKEFEIKTKWFDSLSEKLSAYPDPIILWDMSLLTANNRPVYWEPFPMAQMSYSGVWDETPILQDLKSKKFSIVGLYFFAKALRADRNFSPGFLKAFKENYQFAGAINMPFSANKVMYLYRPKEEV